MIREKLMNDWVIVVGDDECITHLEYNVFTPGTDKNQDFIAILSTAKPPYRVLVLYLAKKTKEFLKFIGCDSSTLIIEFVAHKDRGDRIDCQAIATYYKPGRKTDTIEYIIEHLRRWVSYG